MTRLAILVVAVTGLGIGAFLPALSQTPGEKQPAKKDVAQEKSRELSDALKRNEALMREIAELNRLVGKRNVHRDIEIKKLKQHVAAHEAAKDGRGPVMAQRNLLLLDMLDQTIETKGLQERVKLKTALEYFYEKFGGKLPIVVDREAFPHADHADGNPYEAEVILPPVPSKMLMSTALRLVLSQVGKGNATYLVRQGVVEITTLENARASRRLQETISARFVKRPLSEVLEELANENGVNINLDPKVGKKADTPITAAFRNSPLEDALVTITESAGLKFVPLVNSIYVTTPEKAKRIEHEQRERDKNRPAFRESGWWRGRWDKAA